MGQYFLYDAFQGILENWVDFDLFGVADIDEIFLKNFKTQKFSQEVKIFEDALTITPYCAGHMIGGAIWRIMKDSDEILYAIDYNHRRERHLSESYAATFQRPTLLITDAYNLDNEQIFKRQKLDQSITSTVMETLRVKGNVLIPTDAAGRIFEIGAVLYNHWRKNQLFPEFSLVFLSYTSKHSVEMIRTMLEWMNDDCRRKFDEDRKNIYKWSKFIIARNLDELWKLARPPMCVLTSNIFCENGFSKELIDQWGHNPNNCILLTERVSEESLAGKLHGLMETRRVSPGGSAVRIQRRVKVPLEGQELEEFNERQRLKAEEEERKRQEELAKMKEEMESDEEMEDVEEKQAPIVKAYYPMFDWVNHDDQFDIYGAPLDFKVYEDEEELEIVSQSREDGPNRSDFQEPGSQPFKSIVREQELNIQCKVRFVNFEGRVDGKAVRSILQYMQPKKVIAVHSSTVAKNILKEYCESELKISVSVPGNMERIEVSTSTRVYSLQLENILDNSLNYVKVRGYEDYEVAYVEGMVKSMETEQNDHPVLRTVPPEDRKKFSHQGMYLGEVQPLEIKQALVAQNHDARFISSTLVAGNDENIRIEKRQDNTIRYRGTLTDDYFGVRDVLYSKYHLM